MYSRYLCYLLLAGLVGALLTACDLSSQNVEFEAGENLTVIGPAEVTLAEDVSSTSKEYYVRTFTIEQQYDWSASGSAEIVNTRRDGEYVEVSFSDTGSYTVEVTTTIDGESYSGARDVQVARP